LGRRLGWRLGRRLGWRLGLARCGWRGGGCCGDQSLGLGQLHAMERICLGERLLRELGCYLVNHDPAMSALERISLKKACSKSL